MTHIFVCPSLRGGLKLNKTRFQLRVNTTDYNWCLIPILSNSWKLVKSYSVVLHVNPYESLSRSSQQWISEPKAMFSQENTTHSKASQKLSSKLFPQKGNPFFNWGSLVAFNCYLASMPAAFARAPLDGAVPVGMPRCSMLFGDLFTVNPNPKNVKDHPNHPKSKTQFKSKSKQTTSNFVFCQTVALCFKVCSAVRMVEQFDPPAAELQVTCSAPGFESFESQERWRWRFG